MSKFVTASTPKHHGFRLPGVQNLSEAHEDDGNGRALEAPFRTEPPSDSPSSGLKAMERRHLELLARLDAQDAVLRLVGAAHNLHLLHVVL